MSTLSNNRLMIEVLMNHIFVCPLMYIPGIFDGSSFRAAHRICLTKKNF